MIRKKPISSKPKAAIRRKPPVLSRAQILSIYKEHVRKASLQSVKPVTISQRNIVIGTGSDWTNAITVQRNSAWRNIDNANYVWSQRDPNGQFAVVSRRFNLPQNRDIERGRLLLAVDNYAVVLINGRIVVYDNPQANVAFFNPGREFNIRSFLRRGRNDIVIIAFNFEGNRSSDNPAGVAARLNIRVD